jgi:cytochrome P450
MTPATVPVHPKDSFNSGCCAASVLAHMPPLGIAHSRCPTASVARVVDSELAKLDGQDEIELVRDFAVLLPTRVILDVMGIGHEHLDRVVSMAHVISSLYEPDLSDEVLAHADQDMGAWAEIVRGFIADRRRTPGPDLLTSLVEATDEGEKLTEPELVAMVVALVHAGHETFGSTLPVSLYHLVNNPAQLELLRSDRSIMKTAVEELLRYDAATPAP